MKNLFWLPILTLSCLFLLTSCKEEALEMKSIDALSQELSTETLNDFPQTYAKDGEENNWTENTGIDQIHWIETSAADAQLGSTSCCIDCVGSVTAGNVQPSDLYYYIHIYELCEGSIVGLPIATLVSGGPNTSIDFPIWDEHEYSLVVQMPGAPEDASMTATISSPYLTWTYQITPESPYSISTRLYCNNYMNSICWPDGERICCSVAEM